MDNEVAERQPVPVLPIALLLAAFGVLLVVLLSGRTPPSRVIDARSARQVVQQDFLTYGAFQKLVWSPDGSAIAVGTDIGVWLYDAHNLQAAPRLLDGHTTPISSLAFSPDGARLISADAVDVRLWDVQSGRQVTVARLNGQRIADPVFSPDLTRAAFSGIDLFVWDVLADTQIAAIPFSSSSTRYRPYVFSADLTRLAFLDVRRTAVQIRDLTTNADITVIPLPAGMIATALALSPDNTALAANITAQDADAAPNFVQLWDIAAGSELNLLENAYENHYPGVFPKLTFSPDGQLLLAYGTDTAHLWDVQTGQDRLAAPRFVGAPAFSRDGSMLAVLGGVLDARTGATIVQTPSRAWASPTALSPDAHLLAVVLDGKLEIWDVHEGAVRTQAAGLFTQYAPGDTLLTPDGSRLVTTEYRTVIRQWDMETGEQLPPVLGRSVYDAVFAPDLTLFAQENRQGKTVFLSEVGRANEQEPAGRSLSVFATEGQRL